MTEPTLDQQLNARKLDEAKTLMQNGEKLSKNIQEHQKSSILDNLVREKHYEILNMLVKDKTHRPYRCKCKGTESNKLLEY